MIFEEPLGAAELPTGRVASPRTRRVSVDVRALDQSPLHSLRLLLVADVLRRLAEDLQGDTVLLAVLEDATGPSAALAASAKALAIREPSMRTRSPSEAAAMLGGPAEVAFEPARPGMAAESAAAVLRIGAVATPHQVGAPPLGSDLLRDHEPLALRLALLRFPYSSPAMLSRARLHRAEETLERWRFKVAGWKDMPAAPALPDIVSAARDALLANLDASAVLTLLHRLEIDQSQASGSKFETFTYLDRVLALDLRRLVGKTRWY